MFYKEYKVASCIQELLWGRLQIRIDEHEIGYLALHVHSAIEEEKVSQAMEVARAVHGEKLKVNINDYMSVKFPDAFQAAKQICEEMEKRLRLPMEEIEIGYLAMHMERIMDREEGE